MTRHNARNAGRKPSLAPGEEIVGLGLKLPFSLRARLLAMALARGEGGLSGYARGLLERGVTADEKRAAKDG